VRPERAATTEGPNAEAPEQGTSSRLARLSALGQSVWIDFLSRESTRSGHLQRLIDEDAVVGATSNPTIFEKAMSEGSAYDPELAELAGKTSDAS
jgi:transaldolase